MKLILIFGLAVLCANASVLKKRDAAGEIKAKYGDFRENCYPRGSVDGCKCTESVAGNEEVKTYDTDEECKKSTVAKTVENKAALNEEFKEKFGSLKENCFPRPKGGCRCVEKDTDGNEQTKLYDTAADCNLPAEETAEETKPKTKRDTKSRDPSPTGASQNVRDPVREKAAQNYQAVLNELKEKFKGLKEGCFPRPKGCLCVIGKDADGRDRTERRMKDADCKCQEGETGPGCPAAGA